MSNKGLIIAFIVIILLVGFTVLMFFAVKGFNKENKEVIETQELRLKAFDVDTNNQISVYFCVYNEFKTPIICSTTSENSITLLNLTVNNYSIIFVNNKYYSMIDSLIIENNYVLDKTYMLKPKGEIEITYPSEWITLSEFTINATSNHNFQNPNICFRWSTNIINVETNQAIKECYNNFTYVNGIFKCKDDFMTYKCNDIILNKTNYEPSLCYLSSNIPKRYEYKVDKCQRILKDITNQVSLISIKVQSNNINQDDRIEVYFYDEDYMFEYGYYTYEFINSTDTGNKDFQFIIE